MYRKSDELMYRKSDKLMIFARALDTANRYPTQAVTRQFSLANINQSRGHETFGFLEKKGFLRKTPFRKNRFNYHITNKGLDLLRQINSCYEVLNDKRTIGVMQFA